MNTVTASVLALTFIATLSLIACVLVTVISRQSVRDALRSMHFNDSMHAQHMAGLLDRFQAMRWEDLAAMRSIDEPDEGGWSAPDTEEEPDHEITQTVPSRWGAMRVDHDETQAMEDELLEQDFPREKIP